MKKNKYLVSFRSYENICNAGSKAPADWRWFFIQNGGEIISVPYLDMNMFWRKFALPFIILRLAVKSGSDSDLYVISPEEAYHPSVRKILNILKPHFRRRRISTNAIMLDLLTNRFNPGDIMEDVNALNLFDRVIAHSPAMVDILKENGCTADFSVLGLLDYHVDKPFTGIRHNGHDICFAGNLHGKSQFLRHLSECGLKKARFLLYGRIFPEELKQDNVEYKGKFDPENLSGVEGNWGLVWDGDSTERLEGTLGRYLTLNSPHKASMYVMAGLPIIAPEESFTADVVRKYGLGIVIRSISEIDEAIENISDEEYRHILSNLSNYSEKLGRGQNLMDVMK